MQSEQGTPLATLPTVKLGRPAGFATLRLLYGEDADALHELISVEALRLERAGKPGHLATCTRDSLRSKLGRGPEQPWGEAGLTVGARDEGGELVASCCLSRGLIGSAARLLARSWLSPAAQTSATSSTLVVRSDLRGRGLGTALHDVTIQIARQLNLLHFGSINSTNSKALHIYLRQGALLLDLAPSPDLAGSSTLLIAFSSPGALGVELAGAKRHFELDVPVDEWLPLLGHGLVGAFDGEKLVFQARGGRITLGCPI